MVGNGRKLGNDSMDYDWQRTFGNRMQEFNLQHPPSKDDIAISVKVRIDSGCFHREHSPHAYKIIDDYLASIPNKERCFAFVEHESGPEVLMFVTVATAGILLAKSIIEFITTIIKARSEGIHKGDSPSADVELIVRRMVKDGEFREEKVLRFGHMDAVDKKAIQREFKKALKQLVKGKKKSKK